MNLLKLKMYATHCIYGLTFNMLYGRKYDRHWDEVLNTYLDAIDNGLEYCVDKHTLNFKNQKGELTEVWVSNFQYCYGHLYTKDDEPTPTDLQFRPSIHTMIRLEKLVREYREEDELRHYNKYYY